MHVLLCDDHQLFLEVMRPALEGHGYTVDVSRSVDEAVERYRSRHADVAVLDVCLPQSSGIDVARRILALDPAAKVVVLTGLTDPSVAREAVEAGVVGIAHKARPLAETVRMLEVVLAGGTVLDGYAIHRPAQRKPESTQQWLAGFLTPREREVLIRLVRGESTARIASGMGIGLSTARTHVQSVLTKLGVHSRVEACSFAVRHHIVELPAAEN
jgi:two-component system nitrate/nitrite response regulator NarL